MKGTIYRRGCKCNKKRCTCGSKWAFTVDVGIDPTTGKRKQKSKSGFRTKQEAEVAITTLLNDIQQGTYQEERKILFKDYADDWIPLYAVENNVKPGTIRIRQHEINKLLPYFAHLKLKNVNRKIYQEAINDLKEKGFAHNTLDGVHRTGKMLFRKALAMGYIKVDPTEFTYLKRDKKSIEELEAQEIPKYMEKEELALFLETASTKGLEMDHLMFLVLSYTGMRVGELIALKWKDIHFHQHTISITKTYYNPSNNTIKYELVTPKTRRSKRTIIVDEMVIAALEAHRKAQQKVMQHFGGTYHDGDFIFAKTDRFPGYPIFIKTVENRMARLLKMAALNKELTPHSLRHTHTSLLAEAKVGLEEIMDRLGHSDDETTKNVYLHITKELKKEASQKFSQLMRSLQ
ncbi:tyrosine-type recombinase/integrase [Bacillus sp. TE8-1]|uniref:site-specific integrase n=1 Tax=Bacillus sp. TE8-1 TaxID=2217829 RepID=UPI0011F03744|nr:tyrosine-type recombinase/integrase [Bacillus sp. TE8-1]KAA0761727.1 site-specific integrase [Bacillus sp. TE8-1]